MGQMGGEEKEGQNTHTSCVQIHEIPEILKSEQVRGHCATMRLAIPVDTDRGRKEQKLHKKYV